MARRAHREAEGVFVAEGSKLVGEALASQARVEGVYFARDSLDDPTVAQLVRAAESRGIRCFELAAGIMERVTDAVTPQGVLCVVHHNSVPLSHLVEADFVVVCVGVRDPGNAGTIVRTAEAAGAQGVVFCHDSVDLYNPKTVRSSAGALFHVPVVVEGEAAGVLERMGGYGLARIGTVARGGADYAQAPISERVALVVGNEAHGLPQEIEGSLDALVTVPIAGRAESLNVGMATAVVCFEIARRRRVDRAPI